MPYNYRKTAYELVKEAAHSLGKDGTYEPIILIIPSRIHDSSTSEGIIEKHRELKASPSLAIQKVFSCLSR
ncbi:hypothetical protein B6U96_17355 [Archaeoglobales archaeon ex4484_92]|nr:MAG: hypothetical protein B6U96_17355 [Archaeoglobales archaeon ex4484_92]